MNNDGAVYIPCIYLHVDQLYVHGRARAHASRRVLGLLDLAATNSRGSVRWDVHTGGFTANDGSLTGKLKWTKDKRFQVE